MAETNTPIIRVDWGGDDVVLHVNSGSSDIGLRFSDDRAEGLIGELQWAIREIRRYREAAGQVTP